MKKSVCFMTLAVLWACLTPVLAQDAALVQAARKEASVVWYTSVALPSATAIAHAFKQKYTGIEVEVHRTGSERVLQRFMQEAAAGIKNADIIDTSDAGHFELLRAKGCCSNSRPRESLVFPTASRTRPAFTTACGRHFRSSLTIPRLFRKKTRLKPGRNC